MTTIRILIFIDYFNKNSFELKKKKRVFRMVEKFV